MEYAQVAMTNQNTAIKSLQGILAIMLSPRIEIAENPVSNVNQSKSVTRVDRVTGTWFIDAKVFATVSKTTEGNGRNAGIAAKSLMGTVTGNCQ